MVRLSVGELRDSFGRALLGTNMALPKKGRWSWDMLSRKIHLACQRKILARHFLNPMVLIQPKLSELLGLEEVPWGFTKEMRFLSASSSLPLPQNQGTIWLIHHHLNRHHVLTRVLLIRLLHVGAGLPFLTLSSEDSDINIMVLKRILASEKDIPKT